MILREVINEPRWKYTFWYFSVQIDAANMHFVNLEGLPDGSLILSVRLRSSACAVYGNTMKVKEKISGFALPPVRSRLYHDLYHCNWPQMNLQIYLPEEKLVEWKTVALILKSFGRVTVDQWSDMVWNMKNRPSVAGLNWRAIEKEIREDEKKLVDQKVEEKRQSDMLKENNAPILQIQPNILVQQVA
ncbi:hypothetical protein BDV25DRAFT_169895 [Aspergillus avenaceus]|uniref:Amylase n=1 Tax=Aspergillus avenaceus TaxID=36643 RepID=A0A5N6TJ94_ASPAV|nr:hypothetical protein BDV25DRAFT_169895 [Aspergillus avenaceus]